MLHRDGCLQLQVGPVKIGSEHPIALQTMTTTDTRNIQATVDQVRLLTLHMDTMYHNSTSTGTCRPSGGLCSEHGAYRC